QASWGTVFSTSLAPGYLRATRRHAAEIWHSHFPNPLADLACLFGGRTTPLIVSYHSDVVRQRGLMALYRHIQAALLRRAMRIVVSAPQIIENSPWLARHREKCEVIPFGLNLDRFQLTPGIEARAAKLRGSAEGKLILLNIGRLVGYKGQRYAIEA